MRYGDSLRLALRMFSTRPLRTALTILGVSVGIGTVFFLVSLGYGLQETILNRIANGDTLLTLDVSAGSNAVQLTDSGVEAITQMPHVQEVARSLSFSAQVTGGNLTSDVPIVAVDPSYFRYSGITASLGSLLTPTSGRDAVITGAATKLFGATSSGMLNTTLSYTLYVPHTDSAGNVTVGEETGSLVVRGVTTENTQSSLYVPLPLVSSLHLGRSDALKVKVDNHANLEAVRNAILAKGYIVSALSDVIDQASKVFSIVQFVLGFFGLVALIVSAIGMFNTMTIALMERTNEIGIMRSIGITRGDIRTMFLVESMVMGLLGGLGGLLLGSIVGESVNFGMNALAHRFGGPGVNLFVAPLWFIIVIIAFSAVIGLLTGVYPSVRASKLNPLDALRYK